ncbi:PREDICTED: pathogenesis-related protein 1-like [Camelina sativa]|uniref:Pathogenesis-related protein 1-like n=1 Tax=Camelina sativa TaxID=90675 RepID=A0ABM0U913_CAMSA|nr:PREDICTED: pathogenesis-related protein 1-like [Camelina sativa]
MKIFNSSQVLILVALALVLAFAVPLKAQDRPQDYLDVHNHARDDVNVPHIRWHAGAARYAWNYAQQRKRDCRLVHSNSGGRYGENLAWSSGDMSGAAAVRLWVKEKSDYFYNSNRCRAGKQCGHYTQVVWRNSAWVGCAKVKCDNGGTFVTCNYSPPGNIRGRRPY